MQNSFSDVDGADSVGAAKVALGAEAQGVYPQVQPNLGDSIFS
jgi:hypothetical protein